MTLREWIYMTPLVICFIWIGIYPKPFFKVMEVSVKHLVEQVNPEYFQKASHEEAKVKKLLKEGIAVSKVRQDAVVD